MSDQINQDRHPLSGAAPIILAADFGVINPADAQYGMVGDAGDGELSSLGGATAWINSEPLTAADLRGHAVLVEFWTYTCINWLRTLPYVRAWVETYRDQGLVVIGIHTPEFPFEHDIENVRRAALDLRVPYSIAIDNEFAIWRGFENHYWPALYLFDPQGNIRYHHFGEGEYIRSEMMIRRLLAAAGTIPSERVGDGLVSASIAARGAEAAADWSSLESPETYLGYERTENFASPDGLAGDTPRVYAVPTQLRRNQWALSGEWTIAQEAAVLNTAHGRIAYRFHARDLNLVMGPEVRGASVRFRVFLDGRPVDDAHGSDTDAQGNGKVVESRLYQLIRQAQPITERQFEIEFLDQGVAAFAFTFG